MGADLCCALEQSQNKFRGDLYKIQAFQLVSEMPNTDPIIQQWISENKHLQQSNIKQQQPKLMKLKVNDTYYYCAWKDSLAQGPGFAYKPNVLFFSGSFKHGVPQGKATVKFLSEACQYEGQVKGWRAHGQGTLQNSKSNYKITGIWENSKLKNAAITFYADHNISNIQINDFNKGMGSISYKDGRYYEGDINVRKLIPNGNGKITFPFGSSKKYYEGQWYDGQISGKGKLFYNNKTQYEGQFFQGQKQGFGKFIFQKGTYFEGYWHKGKQLGVGAIYSILGDVKEYGIWQKGKKVQTITKQKWRQLNQLEKSKHTKVLNNMEDQVVSFSEDFQKYQIKTTESKIQY